MLTLIVKQMLHDDEIELLHLPRLDILHLHRVCEQRVRVRISVGGKEE
jgi:hypothetical protein